MDWYVHHGSALETLRKLPAASVDSVVTDPPYGLSFMGKKWDYDVPDEAVWAECLRVLKPGGYLLAFAGTRTQHRMAVRIEDAGFEIRDMIAWVYGSGFPKSLDVSKAIDKAASAEREVIGVRTYAGGHVQHSNKDKLVPPIGTFARTQDKRIETAPATKAAHQWQGWGTALKPALEPITVARKPLEGTVAQNVLAHGTGALNVDGTRIPMGDEYDPTKVQRQQNSSGAVEGAFGAASLIGKEIPTYNVAGRWPANFIHDGSDEVLALFPDTGKSTGGRTVKRSGGGNVGSGKTSEVSWTNDDPGYGDSGSAARFFYCAKASKSERNEGCEDVAPKQRDETRKAGNPGGDNPRNRGVHEIANHHPTVKPVNLMRYLVRLVTQKGGVVLDPFAGSGSTGIAALAEGVQFIGIEREAEYVAIARKRLESASRGT